LKEEALDCDTGELASEEAVDLSSHSVLRQLESVRSCGSRVC